MGWFAADEEILEMAVAREVDANRFYLALATRFKKPRYKDILLALAREEAEHKLRFQAVSERLFEGELQPIHLFFAFPWYFSVVSVALFWYCYA